MTPRAIKIMAATISSLRRHANMHIASLVKTLSGGNPKGSVDSITAAQAKRDRRAAKRLKDAKG